MYGGHVFWGIMFGTFEPITTYIYAFADWPTKWQTIHNKNIGGYILNV
jgi:hypothetical protein